MNFLTMDIFFACLAISFISISLVILLVGGLTWVLSTIFNSRRRKKTTKMLMIGAGIGSTLPVVVYSLSQFSGWVGQAILGMLLIPYLAAFGGILGAVCMGIYLEISQK